MGDITFAKHSFAAIAFTCAMLTLSGCGANEPEADAQSANTLEGQNNQQPFQTTESLITHLNQITSAGPTRCKDLVELLYPETPFQQEFVALLRTIARAEELDDAVQSRFGESLYPHGDISIKVAFGHVHLVSEEDRRAEAAVESGTSWVRKLLLVHANNRWWISGYTWEYSMSDAQRAEVSHNRLSFEVEAQIAPALLAKLNAGEFETIASVQDAHRQSVLGYFRTNPEMFEKITGKPYRPPD